MQEATVDGHLSVHPHACRVYQQTNRPTYMRSGVTTHSATETALETSDPRPLRQAVETVRKEYGWIVDFEDPRYSAADLEDDTDPKWRAAHPGERGVSRIRGRSFKSTFPRVSDPAVGSNDEYRTLTHLVNDYNAGNNPGKFAIKDEGHGRFAITGVSAASPLDELISINPADRSLAQTINLILQSASAKAGVPVHLGSGPINLLLRTRATIGGNDLPARDLLMRALSTSKRPVV